MIWETAPADGAYDTKACHQLIARKGANACIPPRKNAGLWEERHPRNETVLVMRKEGLPHWKKSSGYHRRSLAETVCPSDSPKCNGYLGLGELWLDG